MDEFNMYKNFINDESFKLLPFINIKPSPQDIFIQWNISNRLDKLAYTYYNNAAFGKYILLANPKYLSEGDIEVGDILRIPMPKDYLINSIKESLNNSIIF